MIKKSPRLLTLAVFLVGFSCYAQIAPGFQPGNLSVLRIGTTNTPLVSSGDPVFLDEYTTDGVLTNSVSIPTNGATSLIIGGSASSEGAISRSANGNYIVLVGYNTNLTYGSSLANSTSSKVPRGVATVDFNGNYTFVTNTTTAFSANNIRSGTSDGSNNFWAVGANSGTVYMGIASPPATVQSADANSEVANIFNGNLYFSSQKTSPIGVYGFTGTPTTTNSVAALFFATGSGSSLYGFAISPDNTTAYVADDRAIASGGGIQKYTNNGAWGLAYTLGTGASSTVGARGLAVQFGATNLIYATTAESATNRIIAITDTGAAATATTLATAATNEIFRGIQFAPQGNAPAIVTGLESQDVNAGQTATFSVGATGSGSLYYLWESNSTPITGWETNATLSIDTTGYSAGTFDVQVLVSNAWGLNSSTATLMVIASNTPPPPPIIVTQPTNASVKAGATVSFSVGATGSDLSFQWLFEGVELSDGGLISGATTNVLTLSDVGGANAGTYTVTVTNEGGSTNSQPVTLTVEDPWISTQPTGRTYLAGGTIDLVVGAFCTTPTYQWTFDGAAISGATSSVFLESNAVPSESGSYAVIVTSPYGSVTSVTAVVVVAASQTTFFPSNLVVLRLGDGAQPLTNSGNTLFLDQLTTSGSFVDSMALPDVGPSALLISGVASSEGYMTRSGDGRLLAIGGYNTNRGSVSGSLSSSTAMAVPRAIGTIDGTGVYALAASTTNAYSADNIRAGATDGAGDFWAAGSAGGTWYLGTNDAATNVQNSVANTRVVNVFQENLYFSTQSGTTGLYLLPGLPTNSATTNLLFATGNSSSPEDFQINDATNLVYIADDSSSGGIQRWEFSNGIWANAYTLASGASKIGARSLTVDFSGANPVIYAITAETSANRLITVTDAGAGSAPVTLATAPAGELFRAVKFSPALIPFPAPSLTTPALVNGNFTFNLSGVNGFSYVVQTSTNLIDWTALQTNTAPASFTVTNAVAGSAAYFRAVYIP